MQHDWSAEPPEEVGAEPTYPQYGRPAAIWNEIEVGSVVPLHTGSTAPAPDIFSLSSRNVSGKWIEACVMLCKNKGDSLTPRSFLPCCVSCEFRYGVAILLLACVCERA